VGSQSFTEKDKLRAFEIMKRMIPYGANKWDHTAAEYNKEARAHGRKERDAHYIHKNNHYV
jgi:hypothetical protein